MKRALVAAAVVAGVAGHARAEPEAHPRRVVSVTFSPIHLILPVVEVTVEGRMGDKIGLGGVLGVGSVAIDNTDDRAGLFELGGTFRYYVVGSFRSGVQIGGEFLYVHANGTPNGVAATASGVSVGPFVGYKWTADLGFTFDAQLGVAATGIGAESGTSTESESDIGPLLNLNAGWSF